jgi:L-lysine 2,3-aminomutase
MNSAPRFRTVGRRDIDSMPQLESLSPADRLSMKAVSAVLPFRASSYVVDELIDWSNVPNDPIFQLTFPQRGMLEPADSERLERLIEGGAKDRDLVDIVTDIRGRLNPHPAAQFDLNVPVEGGGRVEGIQHKYRETVLFFPSQGQTCHSYCTYCFRWPQFVGHEEHFASSEAATLVGYLDKHPGVASVLFTGGDPLVMKTAVLRRYLDPLLEARPGGLNSVRIGTKSVAFWPYRFFSDPDADDLLRLFEKVVRSGLTLALMAHYSHPRELATPAAEKALSLILSTGAVVRCQAPMIRHVNDDAATWAELWRREVQLGAVPYYTFVARDTGARRYFEVPLARAHQIFRDAFSNVSGLARTVRGPSMSATPGKVVIDGVSEIHGEKVFVLRLLQARDPAWVGVPFFAHFDAQASWLDDLRPAFGEREFFWEAPLREMIAHRAPRPWLGSDERRSLRVLTDSVEAA